MALHDSYARRTPYELAFPDPDAADALVRSVEEEAQARGLDPAALPTFFLLAAVGDFVRELRGPEAPPESLHDYVSLIYHGFHFHRAGCPVNVVGEAAARRLVEGPLPRGAPEPPTPSGYAQLPRHLFWVGGDRPGAPAEPVDGFFWAVDADGALRVLLATGIREDRPGLAVVAVPEAPLAEARDWLDARVREHGGDFATTLPGGELERLYSLTAAGEALKLAARLFAYMDSAPERIESRGVGEGADTGDPAPSRLPYRRITDLG